MCNCFFFFFKQKTAYEIYQCDWSSDVCSSDLDANSGHVNAADLNVPNDLIYEGITTYPHTPVTRQPSPVPNDLIYEGITT